MHAKSAEELVFVNMVEKKIDAKNVEAVVFVNMVDEKVYAKIAEEEDQIQSLLVKGGNLPIELKI